MAANASVVSLPPATGRAGGQATRYWQALAARERLLVVAAALAVGLLVVWLLAIQPALRTLREAPIEIDRLDRQLQQMQLAATEAQALRSASPIPTAQAIAALQTATERLGGKSKLVVQGDRATLTFTATPAEALRGWLGEARSGARARPVEAQWIRAGDGYSGNVAVVLGSSS